MNRLASTFAYIGSVAAATLAAALMSDSAFAEGPIDTAPSHAGALSRADVRADLMQHRAALTSYAVEWKLQQGEPLPSSSTTRAQVRADYIAARDEVHAMTAEDGGSSFHARLPRLAPETNVAGAAQR